MQNNQDKPVLSKPHWYSIQEAAEYLDVGEPTIYRWMRDQRITFRKVGDSTRFLKEDLDAVIQVFRSAREADKVQEVCPLCHQGELVEGHIQSTGLCYFRPAKAKFWTLKDSNVGTRCRMCQHCGAILWFGDKEKLAMLREEPQPDQDLDKTESAEGKV